MDALHELDAEIDMQCKGYAGEACGKIETFRDDRGNENYEYKKIIQETIVKLEDNLWIAP